jgi:hypothetical protein
LNDNRSQRAIRTRRERNQQVLEIHKIHPS